MTITTRMHFAAIFVMLICVTHERFFTHTQIDPQGVEEAIICVCGVTRNTIFAVTRIAKQE